MLRVDFPVGLYTTEHLSKQTEPSSPDQCPGVSGVAELPCHASQRSARTHGHQSTSQSRAVPCRRRIQYSAHLDRTRHVCYYW